MGELVNLHVTTTLDVDPARVLAEAASEKFKRVIVIGVLEDGQEFLAFSNADGGTLLWDVERAKWKVFREAEEAIA